MGLIVQAVYSLLFIIQSLGEFQPAEFSGAIYCELPHSKIYDFSGYMYVIVSSVLCNTLCSVLCNMYSLIYSAVMMFDCGP